MAEKRARISISGMVQGVSFRYYTVRQAENLGITGWVRNTSDGRVEITAEGTKPALDELISWCEEGPPAASVHSVETDWSEPTGEFSRFSVKY